MSNTSAAILRVDRGVWAALAAAALFGAGAPFAKMLLAGVGPWMLAALLYLGSGLGLALWRRVRRAAPVRPSRAEWGWLAGATLSGGVIGPVLPMTGLGGAGGAGRLSRLGDRQQPDAQGVAHRRVVRGHGERPGCRHHQPRHRVGAYFSVARFFGALLAVARLGERLEPALRVAGTLILLGVWLHLAERHGHVHTHEHEHEDEHHAHEHGALGTGRGAHTHHHVHQPVTHAHGHYPDAHHGHRH